MSIMTYQSDTVSSGMSGLTPSRTHQPENELSLAMINAPFPDEPEGISIEQRHALYAEMPEIRSLMHQKTNSNLCQIVFFASSVIAPTSGVFAFVDIFIAILEYIYGEPKSPLSPGQSLGFWVTTMVGLTCMITTFTSALFIQRENRRERVRSAISIIQHGDWRTLFLKALSGVENRGIDPSMYLRAVRHSILSETQDRHQLPMSDIVGMVRLSSSIVEASTRHVELRGKNHPLDISGESSELLSRVCEALSHKTLDEIMSDISKSLII